MSRPRLELSATENPLWSRPLDGRAILGFVQWIEPRVLETHVRSLVAPHEHPPEVRAALVQGSAFGRALVRIIDVVGPQAATQVTKVAVDQTLPCILLRQGEFTEASPSQKTAISHAYSSLKTVGLEYLVDLALGLIAVDAGPLAQLGGPDLALLEATTSDDWGVELLCAAAESWCAHWWNADVAANGAAVLQLRQALDWDACLRDSVVALYEERSTGQACSDRIARLAHFRDQLLRTWRETDIYCVAAEMCCYFMPTWNRAQFAIYSPFNRLRRLEAFPATVPFELP